MFLSTIEECYPDRNTLRLVRNIQGDKYDEESGLGIVEVKDNKKNLKINLSKATKETLFNFALAINSTGGVIGYHSMAISFDICSKHLLVTQLEPITIEYFVGPGTSDEVIEGFQARTIFKRDNPHCPFYEYDYALNQD